MSEALSALVGMCSSALALFLVQRAALRLSRLLLPQAAIAVAPEEQRKDEAAETSRKPPLLRKLSARLSGQNTHGQQLGAGSKKRYGSLPGDALAALAGAQMFILFLLLTARPFTSFFLSLCIGLLLLLLNGVKEKVLREPLVLVDIYLLPQVFRYPALYFPFLPVKLLVCGTSAAIVALGLLLFLESPLALARSPGWIFAGLFLALAPIAFAVIMNRGRFGFLNEHLLRTCPVSHDAVVDSHRNGPLAAALMHPLLAGKGRRTGKDFLQTPDLRPIDSRWPANFEQPVFSPGWEGEEAAPHVVVLQAESFFDIRTALSQTAWEILGDFLPNWSALSAEGRTLPTPENAFGAYTMRTEFGVLTGLDGKALGPWAFNPYLLAASRPVWSLARHFKQRGYATLCMHPYHREFFRRHKVMPQLGFETFLALDDLDYLPRFGPYVSDIALGKDILSRLEASSRPVFCFAISMEAHGPWLPGRLSKEEIHETLADLDPHAFEPRLLLYLCHLRRMDQLLGMFRQRMDRPDKGQRQCLFWAYGDHAPAIPFASPH